MPYTERYEFIIANALATRWWLKAFTCGPATDAQHDRYDAVEQPLSRSTSFNSSDDREIRWMRFTRVTRAAFGQCTDQRCLDT